MVHFWRQVGLNYVQYSAICARVVRRCLKVDAKSIAAKREGFNVKSLKWEGGKPLNKNN